MCRNISNMTGIRRERCTMIEIILSTQYKIWKMRRKPCITLLAVLGVSSRELSLRWHIHVSQHASRYPQGVPCSSYRPEYLFSHPDESTSGKCHIQSPIHAYDSPLCTRNGRGNHTRQIPPAEPLVSDSQDHCLVVNNR